MSREDGFNNLRSETKGVTNRESDGLSLGENFNTLSASPQSTFEVSVKKGGKPSDVTEVFTGPGTGTATGVGGAEDSIGWVTSTGNKIAINKTTGSESIEIVHHSGASIVIDVDGSIFLMPTSRKGFGLHSNKGDGVVSAQGRLILKGTSDITIETEGSLNFNVGQNMFLNVGGDMVVDVGRSYSESIENMKVTEINEGDYSVTVAGTLVETVGQDKKVQVIGDVRYDVGKSIEARTDKDIKLLAQKSFAVNAVKDSFVEVSTGKLTVASQDDVTLASKNGIYITSDDDISIDAADVVGIKAGGNMVTSTKGKLYVDATSKVDMRSAALDFSSSGTFNVDASGAITIDSGSTADINSGSASPLSVETTDPRTTPSIETPAAPEYPDANTLLKNLTSKIDSPSFPKNAYKMSAEEMSIYENEGDTPDANAKAAASLNSSGGTPYIKGSNIGTIGDSANIGYDGTNNMMKSEDSPYKASSSIYNSSEKISRNVTMGSFPGLGSLPLNQMGYSRKEIVDNVKHLSYNILDPILEKFGSSVTILHGIRLGQGGSRHYIGKAVDIRATSRDHAETAMIAKWIVENLPYDRCFLEANAQGTIHCHVEAAPPGASGSRTVWTCADPKCQTKVNGLQLSFAQQGLKKMGFA